MKLIIIFAFAACTCVASEQDLKLRLSGPSTKFKTSSGETISLNSAKLFYKDENGDIGPAAEDYLVMTFGNKYPQIVDMLPGPVSSISLTNTDVKGENRLLVYYFAGGNQYGVRLYEVKKESEIVPFKTQPISSNRRSVNVTKNRIVVENEEIGSEGNHFITTDTYVLTGGDCKLVPEGTGPPK
jgi:hypothetical protein